MTETAIPILLTVLFVVAGAVAGYSAAVARGRSREQLLRDGLTAEQAARQQERADAAAAQARIEGRLQSETAALAKACEELEWHRRHNGAVDTKMAPMREAFETLRRNVQESERARVRAQAELVQQVTEMTTRFTTATADVRHEARKLSQVLSRTERRGAWGEMQLRQVVESAGMLAHVHFVEQDHRATETGAQRPDMVVDLAGGRHVVVDSKVPLDAFLRADADVDGDETMALHAQAVAQHITRLGGKEYWRQYDSPEFVVLFLPSEGLLSAALQVRPELLQTALDRKVMLATPTTLLSMLHAIHHAWRQVAAAEQAREIQRAGVEFYQRILTMAQKFDQLGRAITKSVEAYDGTISTLESRVMPSGRRLEKLSVADVPVPELAPVDRATKRRNDAKWGEPSEALATGKPAASELTAPVEELGNADPGKGDELDVAAPVATVIDPLVPSAPRRRSGTSAA